MKRVLPPGTDKCIFCGGVPTTKEHVYSAWSHEYLDKKRGKWRGLVGEESISGPKKMGIIKGRGDIHDWQVKCVCERNCNNGWMRTLENRAIPILTPLIQGKPCKLRKNDQRIIAGWACLKAIIGEYESPQLVSWGAEARSRMMRLKLPPAKECVIVIGRWKRDQHPMHWLTLPMNFLFGADHRGRLGEPTTEFNSATTTQVIGQLFIHVIHAPKLPRILKKFDFPPKIGRKLRFVWPPGEVIDWPPDALTDAEADYIANALYRQIAGAARRILRTRKI